MRFTRSTILLFALCAGTVFGQSRPQLEETACSIFGAGCSLREIVLSLGSQEITALKSANGVSHAWEKVDVFLIEKDRQPAGVLMIDNVKGKSRPITYAVAFDTKGQILALEILAYRESHGGEVQADSFRRQFEGKKRGDAIAVGRDIRNISGATISSRAVTNGARALVTLRQYLNEKGKLE
jgi:Na+-translocating ferredoxin:NAD+ oxidoreductase RnfG subunit